jgi:hypothetical protein
LEYRNVLWAARLLLVIHNFEEFLAMPAFVSRHSQDIPAFLGKMMAMGSIQFAIALIIVS